MSSWGSRRAGSGLLVARGRAVGLLAAASVAGVLWPASAGASTTTFSYTGGEQTYTVPAGVSSLSVTAIGAQGGAQTSCEAAVCPPGDQGPGQPPGRGAIVSGVVSVTPGQILYVEVGGTGGAPAGGFNGGGEAATLFPQDGGGGGASDIRTLPMSAGVISLNSRLIVAAGGGGSSWVAAPGGDAGQPGGSAPYNSVGNSVGGGAGTETTGGAGGCDALAMAQMGCGMAGSLGSGGDGGTSIGTGGPQVGAGGGGGLYGGGGGGGVGGNGVVGSPLQYGEQGGGGGGSSLVPSEMGVSSLASFTTAPAVEITPVPPPTCEGVTTNTPYRQAVTVQFNCTEFAGRALTYAIATAPAHGKLSGDVAGGQVTYTPAAGFSGQDSFTYAASSTNGTSTAVTVSIAVAPRSVARAARAHRTKTGVKIPVRCRVDGVGTGPACDVTVTISTNGVTVGETSSATDTCLACRASTVVIGAGDTRVLTIPLNRKGRHLLDARGKLRVTVVVTQTVGAMKSLVSRQRLIL